MAESPFDARSDGKPLACFLIVNHVLARPECGQRFDSLIAVLSFNLLGDLLDGREFLFVEAVQTPEAARS